MGHVSIICQALLHSCAQEYDDDDNSVVVGDHNKNCYKGSNAVTKSVTNYEKWNVFVVVEENLTNNNSTNTLLMDNNNNDKDIKSIEDEKQQQI